jgi:glycosyltransferase involved in cell wall biosynthesis
MLRPRNARGRRVLIFNHSYPIQFVDVANQYARLFTEAGDEVTAVYLTGKPDEGIREKTLAKEVIFLDCPRGVTRGLKIAAIRQLLKLQREKAFDVVICHRYKPTYIMLWVALFCRLPVFISVMHELGTFRHFARKLLLALFAPKNLILAGVSNAVRDDLRRSVWGLPPGRVLTLYNMIDVELTEPRLYSREEARERLALDPKDFVFGNVGRLAKNKDQKSLIEAFAAIKAACPSAKLIILGDGQLEVELKQQVGSLNLSQEISFAGFVPDGFRYMKAFDVYVSSSTQEAFGRVLLEAMVARVPTIATRVNGMPEVLGDTGFIVDPRAPAQLAKAMREVYEASSQVRSTWGEKAYKRATQEFSIPRFSEVMGKILLPGLDSNQ